MGNVNYDFKEIRKTAATIKARDRTILHNTESLASNLRESRIGENHDYQANIADKIVELQKEQSADIERLVTLTHGGGTGES